MLASLFAAFQPVTAEQESFLQTALAWLGSMRGNFGTIDDKAWSAMTIHERIESYNWRNEMFVILTFVAYILFYIYGRHKNRIMVHDFVKTVDPVLQSQFGLVGCNPTTFIVKDSDTRFTTYASGRTNIESLLIRFRMIDRHNFITYSTSLVIPSMASPDGMPDYVNIELTPTDPKAFELGVFSIVNKNNLAEVQENNQYLKLTKTQVSSELPSPLYAFMLEHNDQIQELFTAELKEALALEGATEVLCMLAYSDMPTTEVTKEEEVSTHPRVYLQLNFPINSAQRLATSRILEATINFVDVLVAKPRFRASTTKRIKATRDAEVARIRKAEEATKKEELEAKKAEERREAARRQRSLSEKEQKRLQKKESDKQARKMRQKMIRK